jgi:murein DD-endopeptidase MepM/ murein hydrolase activator NlpD
MRGAYGLLVEITHRASGYVTRYAHLRATDVKVGDVEKRGDIIAYVGSSGMSTGPHLHYEVRRNGRAVNPRLYMIDLNHSYIID